MKLSHLIIGSLGLNAILATGVVYQRTGRPAAESAESSAVTETTAKKSGGGQKAGNESLAPVLVNVPGEPFSWHRIEAEDYYKYVANLRAIGCPEETIQDIIYNDVTKLYAGKFKALNQQYRPSMYGGGKDYWRSEGYAPSAEWSRKTRELTEEKKALLIALLGVDIEKMRRERMGIPDYEAVRMAFLPEEKRKQAEDIRMRFQDMEQALYQKYNNYYGEERNAEFAEIAKQREAELAKLLSPYELEEYKLRNSQTAQQMKWELQSFEANEEEFRKMFKVREAYDQAMAKYRQGGGPDPDNPEEQRLYMEASKLRDEEMKKVLGETRYREYARAKDYNYQELYRMVQRSELPKETATKVYDMKDAAEAQARKVRSDQSLTAEQRQQALAEIKNLTEKSVQETLGEKNFKSYQSRSGYWMRSLSSESRSSVTFPSGTVFR